MLRSTLVALICCCAATAHGEIRHTSDFGWKAGEDVTSKFEALFRDGAVRSGDELVLDHTYRIRGTHALPDDFTLSAVKGGGFEVVDATKG